MSQKTVAVKRGRRPGGAGRRTSGISTSKTGSGTAASLKKLAQDDPLGAGQAAAELLRHPSPTKMFAEIISWIAGERRDLLGRPGLFMSGGLDEKMADLVCQEMARTGDARTLAALGEMMGMMGRHDPEMLFNLVRKKKLAGMPLLGAVWGAEAAGHMIPDVIASEVLRHAGSRDRHTRNMAIRVAVGRLYENKGAIDRMARLAKSDDETRVWIARCAALAGGMRPEHRLFLLQECAKIRDQRHLTGIAASVGMVASKFPMECLGIVRAWTRRFDSAATDHQVCWIAEQVGASKEADFEKIRGFILDWINTECRRNGTAYKLLGSSLPGLVHDIYKCRQEELFALVSGIDYRDADKMGVIVGIIGTFFSRSFYGIKRGINEEFADLLARIAVHHRLDEASLRGVPQPVMQVLAFVQNIKTGRQAIDPAQARENLRQFPGISGFLTRKKIHKLIDDDRDHPLVRLLARSAMRRKAFKKFEGTIRDARGEYKARLTEVMIGRHHPWMRLDELDGILGGIKQGGLGEARRLMLGDGFHQASTQLGVHARFRQGGFPVQPVPGSPGGGLLVKIKDTRCHFVTYRPKSARRHELDYIRTARPADAPRIGGGIRSNLASQLVAAGHPGRPLVLVLDCHHLGARDVEVRDLLEGSLQLKFRAPDRKAEGRLAGGGYAFNRAVGPGGEMLSAAVLLSSSVDGGTLRVGLRGDIYENPGAMFPLPGGILEEIRGVLFG